jgi:HlyD family secretion protein
MTEMKSEVQKKKNARRPLIVRTVGLLVLLAVFSFLWLRFGLVGHGNNKNHKIVATGTIEATEVDISAEVGGKIEKLLVDEGYHVDHGDLVAKIDDSQLRADVDHAEAALASAQATLKDFEAGARSEELKSARAQVDLANTKLALEETNWERVAQLFKNGLISENQRDAAQANRDVARSQYDVAVEQLRLLEAGSRPDQIRAARGQAQQAEAALQLAKVRLKKTEIRAPNSGTVLVKESEQGEVISPGVPIVTIADLDDMWVKIYIDESDIGNVRLGQPAKVQVDSFPEKEFTGKVKYISDSAEFTPKNIQTREDRVKLVFAVKVGIDNEGGLLKPGMYADIKLESLSPVSQASDSFSETGVKKSER